MIRKFDDLRHGVSEYWHENGTQRLILEYKADRVNGAVKLYAPDGNMIADGNMNTYEGGGNWQMYLKPGQKIVEANFNNGQGVFRAWLWNGVHAGSAMMQEGKIQKKRYLLRLLLRPQVWVSLWQARKPGKDREDLQRMVEYTDLWKAVISEISGTDPVFPVQPKAELALDGSRGSSA